MKTVKDVMSTLPVWVSESASFREIAARLRECRVSAFPVLDAHGKLTGVVSEADLLVKEAVPDEPNVIWGFLASIVHHGCSGRILGRRFDLGLRHRHDRHPCVLRWPTGCW